MYSATTTSLLLMIWGTLQEPVDKDQKEGSRLRTRCQMNLGILTVLMVNGSWKQFSLAATSVSSGLLLEVIL